jgi:hypothetical protein
MELIESTDLHDSRLTDMSLKGDRIQLRFKNVWVDDDSCYNVTVTLGGVGKITRDDEIVSALHTEGEGSNVLEFRRSGQSATMVVVWTYYSTRTDDTRSYEFDFTTFDLQAEKQEPPL